MNNIPLININNLKKINKGNINLIDKIYEHKISHNYNQKKNLIFEINKLKKYYQIGLGDPKINDSNIKKIIIKEKINNDINIDFLLENDIYKIYTDFNINESELKKKYGDLKVLNKININRIVDIDKTEKLIINNLENDEFIFNRIYLDNGKKNQKIIIPFIEKSLCSDTFCKIYDDIVMDEDNFILKENVNYFIIRLLRKKDGSMIGINKLLKWDGLIHKYIDNSYCYVEKLNNINYKIKFLVNNNQEVKSLYIEDNNKSKLGNLFGKVNKSDLINVLVKKKINKDCDKIDCSDESRNKYLGLV